MSAMHWIKPWGLLGGLIVSGTTMANGGHFQVDDAAVTPPQNCELESWVSWTDPGRSATLRPGCNITGNAEWTVPVTMDLRRDELTGVGLEYKRVMWSTAGGPALALTAGTTYDRPAGEIGEYYLNLPLSFQPMDSVTFHVNGGVEHDRQVDDTYATWGLAATVKPVNGPVWILEMADNDRRRDPVIAGGARMTIGSTRWTLDVGLARDTQQDETAFTVGINIPRFF